MKLFEERRGKVLLGLCILSGGGLVISQLAQRTENESVQSVLGFALVFWVIFVARLTYTFAFQQQNEAPAAPAALRVGAPKEPAAKPKKAAAALAAAAEDTAGSEEEDTMGDGKPRRRRTRRD